MLNPVTDDCSVCLMPIEGGHAVLMVCGHLFCISCAKTFILWKPNCPLCRSRISLIKYKNDESEDFNEASLESFTKYVLVEVIQKHINQHIKYYSDTMPILQRIQQYFDWTFNFFQTMWRDFCGRSNDNCGFGTVQNEFEHVKNEFETILMVCDIVLEVFEREFKPQIGDLNYIIPAIDSIAEDDQTIRMLEQTTSVQILNSLLLKHFKVLEQSRTISKNMREIFERKIDSRDQWTAIIHDFECFHRKLLIVSHISIEISKWRRAVFLECESISFSGFHLFYVDSMEKCLICGSELSKLNYIKFINCKHSICAECTNNFSILRPNCPFPCKDKTPDIICRNENEEAELVRLAKDLLIDADLIQDIERYIEYTHIVIQYFYGLRKTTRVELEYYEMNIVTRKMSKKEAVDFLFLFTASVLDRMENFLLMKHHELLKYDMCRIRFRSIRTFYSMLLHCTSRVCTNVRKIEELAINDTKQLRRRISVDVNNSDFESTFNYEEYYPCLERFTALRCLDNIADDFKEIISLIKGATSENISINLADKCTEILDDIDLYSKEIRTDSVFIFL